MKVILSAVGFIFLALVPAVYTQVGCQEACCDYDYKASNESCCKYWVCANGVETEMTCPGGLHWNAKAKACDWPASADCGIGGGAATGGPGETDEPTNPTNPTIPTFAPTTPTDEPTNPTDEPTNPTDKPSACCCDYDYKASNESCCKYWVCANGIEFEMACPGGLHWNEVAKTCDWPSSANCALGGGGGVVTDEPGQTDEPTSPTEEPTNPTDEPTNPTDEPTIPTDEPTIPTEEPTNPTDEPTNPTDEPTIPTDEPTIPTEEPTNPTDEPTNPTDEPTIPTDEPTIPTDEPTIPTDEPTNPTEKPSPCCCDYDYKASNESCCKYWVCANGIEHEMSCPGGLHWNEVAKTCDWPSSANCALGGGGGVVTDEPEQTDEPTSPTEEPTNPTDEPTIPTDEPTIPTDEPTNPTDEPTIPTDEPTIPTEEPTNPTDEPTIPTDEPTIPTEEPTNPTDEPGTGCCVCTPGDYQAIEGEPCKFQVCDNGKWTTMNCPGGLVWNNTQKACAWG